MKISTLLVVGQTIDKLKNNKNKQISSVFNNFYKPIVHANNLSSPIADRIADSFNVLA